MRRRCRRDGSDPAADTEPGEEEEEQEEEEEEEEAEEKEDEERARAAEADEDGGISTALSAPTQATVCEAAACGVTVRTAAADRTERSSPPLTRAMTPLQRRRTVGR